MGALAGRSGVVAAVRRGGPAVAGPALALGLLLLMIAAAPARATHFENTPNWPELLPPDPSNSAATVPLGFDACPGGSTACPRRVILEMYERWRPLNRACDHEAVFALTYLRTTEEFLRTISHQPGFFTGRRWINREDAVFAELYFRAYDAWHAGESAPRAWRIAFRAARSDDLTAIGDLLLGMNAHIQRDLPFTLAAVGLVHPTSRGTRKPDHDRVNFFLQRVADPLQAELARRYDPLFATTDAGPSPFDEAGVLETVRGMRENAWRNAERLVNAGSEADRRRVAASIEQQSALAAQTIVAQNTMPGYGPTRDAWCHEHLRRSFRVRVLDVPLARILRTRRIPVRVFADGPARVRLVVRRVARRRALAAARRPPAVTPVRKMRLERRGRKWARIHVTRRGVRLLRGHAPRVKLRVILRAPRTMHARHARAMSRDGAR